MPVLTDQSRLDVIHQVAVAAVAAEHLTGCPAALLAAQCIDESGWLAHCPGNNCFGIKTFLGCYGRQLLNTTERFTPAERDRFLALGDGRTATLKHPDALIERDGRREYSVQDYFATFASLRDCFIKRSAMWDRGPYAPSAKAFDQTGDLTALVRAIAPIYAKADPDVYSSTLLSLIADTRLQAALAAARQ